MTFEEWLRSIEEDYPEVRLTRTKNLLRATWFASANPYHPEEKPFTATDAQQQTDEYWQRVRDAASLPENKEGQ